MNISKFVDYFFVLMVEFWVIIREYLFSLLVVVVGNGGFSIRFGFF